MSPEPERRPDDEDIDARFAEIVRHLRAPQGDPPGRTGQQGQPGVRRPRWPGTGASPTDPPNPPPPGFEAPPTAESTQAREADGRGEASPGGPEVGTTDAGGAEVDGPEDGGPDGGRSNPSTWREWVDPEVEDHFVPPVPPPLPAGDLHFWGILVGLLCGPLILLLAHGFQVLHGSVWTWLGLLLSLGGFVLLVLRSPTDRDHDPSGGAQV